MKDQELLTNNEQITINQEPKKHFVIVYESVYKNTQLNAQELGFILKMLSLAPNFKINKKGLSTLLHISDREILKITKSLQEKGYLEIKKFGKSSKWTIKQEPIKTLKDFTEKTLLDALLNYEITLKDLKTLHKLKYINDTLFIKVKDAYLKALTEITNTKWLN